MKLVPLGDKVVIKQLEAEEKTKSGIVLPVIAVGPGGYVDGNKVEMTVKEGDKVIYSKYCGTEVECDGEKLLVVKQNDILAVVVD